MNLRQYRFLCSITFFKPVKSVPYFKFLSWQRPILMTVLWVCWGGKKGKILSTSRKRTYRRRRKKPTLCSISQKKRTFFLPQPEPDIENLLSETKYQNKVARAIIWAHLFIKWLLWGRPHIKKHWQIRIERFQFNLSDTNRPWRQFSKQGKHRAWICKCNPQGRPGGMNYK